MSEQSTRVFSVKLNDKDMSSEHVEQVENVMIRNVMMNVLNECEELPSAFSSFPAS